MCDHSWFVAGRWPTGEAGTIGSGATGCVAPLLLVCRTCGERRKIACGTSRASRCEPCAIVYRQRVARVAGSGLVVGRDGLFVTVTAPGTRRHRDLRGRQCPCTTSAVDLGRWNVTASARWNRLWQALARELGAVEVTYDESGARRERFLLDYFRGAELQRRGALHYHVLLRHRDGRPLALRRSVLRRLAIAHGFGHSVDVQAVHPGHATYVAKYVAKAADYRRDVPWNDTRARHRRPRGVYHAEVVDVPDAGPWWVSRRTGELLAEAPIVPPEFQRPTYRTWSKSRLYGRGMAEVKADQQHFVLTMQAVPSWTPAGAFSYAIGNALTDIPKRPDMATNNTG